MTNSAIAGTEMAPIGSRRTELVYLDLEAVTVNGRPLEITSATLTLQTAMTGDHGQWVAETPRWFGQIVSPRCSLDPGGVHLMQARTSLGLSVTGWFLIGQNNSRGVDVAGTGELILL